METTIIETKTDEDGISYELFENSFNPNNPKMRRFGIRIYTEDMTNCHLFPTLEKAIEIFKSFN